MGETGESVTVTAKTLESAAGVFQLSQVVGVRVGVDRGSYAARWLGCMSVLIAVGYGGCFVLADAASGNNTGKLPVALIFFGGLSLFAWSKWLAPARFVVLVQTGGQEVAVGVYREQANAERVVSAVRDSMRRLG